MIIGQDISLGGTTARFILYEGNDTSASILFNNSIDVPYNNDLIGSPTYVNYSLNSRSVTSGDNLTFRIMNGTEDVIIFIDLVGSSYASGVFFNSGVPQVGSDMWFQVYGSVTGASCTYSSGNWSIAGSDNCAISTNNDIGGNSLTVTDGNATVTGNITNANSLLVRNATLTINGGIIGVKGT